MLHLGFCLLSEDLTVIAMVSIGNTDSKRYSTYESFLAPKMSEKVVAYYRTQIRYHGQNLMVAKERSSFTEGGPSKRFDCIRKPTMS